MSPLVSIITPSYNQGRFIRQTIESVLNQSYPNIEYIIIDGGSTDDTLGILNEYSDRIKFISEKDLGQSNAINKGFQLARGEIIAWLNSDDIYEIDAVQTAVNAFDIHCKAGMIYGEGYIIDIDGTRIKRFENTIEFDLWMLLYVWDFILQPTVFFKKTVLESVGFLDETLNWIMDWDLWIRIALKYDVVYCNKFIACSREYNSTKTSTGAWKRVREIRSLYKKYTGTWKTPGYKVFFWTELGKSSYWPLLTNVCTEHAVRVLKTLPVVHADGSWGARASIVVKKNAKYIIFKELPQPPFKLYINKKLRNNVLRNNILNMEQIEQRGRAYDILEFQFSSEQNFICYEVVQ